MQSNQLSPEKMLEFQKINELPSPIKQLILEKVWIENISQVGVAPSKIEHALDPLGDLCEIENQIDYLNTEKMKKLSDQTRHLVFVNSLINKNYLQTIKKFSSIENQKLQLVKIRFLIKNFLNHLQHNHDENLKEYLHHFIFLLKPIEGLNRLSYITEPDKINQYLTVWVKNAKNFYLITQNVLHKKREGIISENSKKITYGEYFYNGTDIYFKAIEPQILEIAEKQLAEIQPDEGDAQERNESSQYRLKFLSKLADELNILIETINNDLPKDKLTQKIEAINWQCGEHRYLPFFIFSGTGFLVGSIIWGLPTHLDC